MLRDAGAATLLRIATNLVNCGALRLRARQAQRFLNRERCRSGKDGLRWLTERLLSPVLHGFCTHAANYFICRTGRVFAQPQRGCASEREMPVHSDSRNAVPLGSGTRCTAAAQCRAKRSCNAAGASAVRLRERQL